MKLRSYYILEKKYMNRVKRRSSYCVIFGKKTTLKRLHCPTSLIIYKKKMHAKKITTTFN